MTKIFTILDAKIEKYNVLFEGSNYIITDYVFTDSTGSQEVAKIYKKSEIGKTIFLTRDDARIAAMAILQAEIDAIQQKIDRLNENISA